VESHSQDSNEQNDFRHNQSPYPNHSPIDHSDAQHGKENGGKGLFLMSMGILLHTSIKFCSDSPYDDNLCGVAALCSPLGSGLRGGRNLGQGEAPKGDYLNYFDNEIRCCASIVALNSG